MIVHHLISRTARLPTPSTPSTGTTATVTTAPPPPIPPGSPASPVPPVPPVPSTLTGTASPGASTRSAVRPPARLRRRLLRALGRHAYAALALPAALIGLVAVALGGARTAAGWHAGLARRLLGVPVAPASPPPGGTARRVAGHSLAGLPVHLLAFALVVPMWGVFLTRGVLYPVFADGDLEHSWGGPTLAGAWVVHFIQGPALLLLVTLLLTPVSRLQARLASRLAESRP